LKNLSRGIGYLLDRTVPRRLALAWHHYVGRRRLAWWDAQIGRRDWVDVKVQDSVRMRLHFGSHIGRHIYAGYFERGDREFLNTLLKSGDVFVDVGANAGLYTLIGAHRVGEGGRVYAFEPCPTTHERLLENVQLNGLANVECHQLALSDREEVAELYVSREGFDAQNSFSPPDAPGRFAPEAVKCITWDGFAEEHNLGGRVAMIKIDVEGWEWRVLRGGRKTLSRPDAPVLQLEFYDQALQSAGSSCQELYRLLQELGYQLFAYDVYSRKTVPEPLRDAYPRRVNLLAAKGEGQLEERR